MVVLGRGRPQSTKFLDSSRRVLVPGSVYAINGATQSTVLAMAADHYGVSTLDELAVKLDPGSSGPPGITSRTSTIAEVSADTTVTGVLPTDRQAGDCVVAVFGMSSTVVGFTPPAGWTELVAPFVVSTDRLLAFYFRFDPPAGPAGVQSVSGRATCVCQAYGGVDPTTPIDVAAATATAAGTPVTVGSITTVTDGARLIGACVADTSTAVITCPASMTQLQESTGTGRRTEMADEVDVTAGATGTRQWSLGTGALGMAAATAALRPATGGPRTMEDFCQAWWGKPFADCIYEILLYERLLQWVRQSSLQQGPLTKDFPLWYGGGDVMDTCLVAGGARVWVGGDTLIALMGYVDLETNEAKINSLPARNHWASEFLNGAVDRFGTTRTADALGAGFASMQGTLASFVTPNQTTYPGTIYWCTAITPSAAADRVAYVAAWLVKVPTPGSAVYDHELLDTHILHIHTFGVPIEIAVFDVGAGGNFWVDDFLVDTAYTYVYAKEYDPSFGDFTPNWGQDLDTDTIYRHVARIPTGTEPTATGHTGSVFTSYEWWTGSGWSNNITNSQRLKDTAGTDIRGDSGVGKIAPNHYVLVAQDPMETQKRAYFSTSPQGPWLHYLDVPAPIFGTDVIPTNTDRTSFNTKVHVDFPHAPDEVMTMCTANGNTFATTSSPAGTYVKAGNHVAEIDIAYYLSVPLAFPAASVISTSRGRMGLRGRASGTAGAAAGPTGRAAGRLAIRGTTEATKGAKARASGRLALTGDLEGTHGALARTTGRLAPRGTTEGTHGALARAAGRLAPRGATKGTLGALGRTIGRLALRGLTEGIQPAAGITGRVIARLGLRGTTEATKATTARSTGRLGLRGTTEGTQQTTTPGRVNGRLALSGDLEGTKNASGRAQPAIALRGDLEATKGATGATRLRVAFRGLTAGTRAAFARLHVRLGLTGTTKGSSIPPIEPPPVLPLTAVDDRRTLNAVDEGRTLTAIPSDHTLTAITEDED